MTWRSLYMRQSQLRCTLRLALGGITAAMSRSTSQSSNALGSIPFVSYKRAGAYSLHEERGLGDVRCLASRQNKAYGQTQRICQRLNLATKTATRAAQRFGSCVARGRACCTGVRPYHGAVDADILHIGLNRDTRPCSESLMR